MLYVKTHFYRRCVWRALNQSITAMHKKIEYKYLHLFHPDFDVRVQQYYIYIFLNNTFYTIKSKVYANLYQGTYELIYTE